MEQMQTQELISALADGQLQGEALARAVAAAAADPAAREAWHTYHLIGDVLRSGELAAGTTPVEFLGRLQARLQREEPFTGMAPAAAAAAGDLQALSRRQPAANDPDFRWKLVAGFASVAAVMALAWSVMGGSLPAAPEQAQLAGTPPPVVLAGSPATGVMIRDPRLDEFLAAHRQLAGASALQMPSGFLRNATFESGSR
jgi:sigma-E factor negative regulatory protein RseA